MRLPRLILAAMLMAAVFAAGCQRAPVAPRDLRLAERMYITDVSDPEVRLAVEDRSDILEIPRLLDITRQQMTGEPVAYTLLFVFPDGSEWKVCVTSQGWFFAEDGRERRDTLGLYDHVEKFWKYHHPAGAADAKDV